MIKAADDKQKIYKYVEVRKWFSVNNYVKVFMYCLFENMDAMVDWNMYTIRRCKTLWVSSIFIFWHNFVNWWKTLSESFMIWSVIAVLLHCNFIQSKLLEVCCKLNIMIIYLFFSFWKYVMLMKIKKFNCAFTQ